MSYLIIFNVIFLFFLLNKKIKINENLYKFFLVIILCIFLCFSYFNGSDWRNYETQYQIYNLNNYLNYPFEKGYSLYAALFKNLGIEFFNYFIFTKILCFLSFIYILNKYSTNFYFALMIFFTQLGLYLFIDCPLRTLLSISIFLIGILYFEKNIFIYYCLVILAYHFHKSCAIFFILPILYFFYKKLNVNKIVLIIIFLILLFIFSTSQTICFIIEHFTYFPTLQWRFYNYLRTDLVTGEILNIRLLEKIIIILLALYNKEKIEKKFKYGKIILFLSVIFVGLYRIGISIPILVRVALYLRIFYIVLLTYLLRIFKNNIIKFIFIIGYYFYSLIAIYFITQDIRYIPYTTYIKYIFQEKPNFHYRSYYNENYKRSKK